MIDDEDDKFVFDDPDEKVVKLGEIWIERDTALWVGTNRATFLPEQDVLKKYRAISLSTEFVQSSEMDIIFIWSTQYNVLERTFICKRFDPKNEFYNSYTTIR